MKQYILEGGFYSIEKNGMVQYIPDDANDARYQKMMQEVSNGEAEIIENVISLDSLKEHKKSEIDKRTDELILQGINHNSVDFKINIEKEVAAIAMNAARMAGADMAGKKFRGKNQTYTFTDNTDFDAWFAAAFGRLEAVIIAGSELKDDIDAANDVEGIDAVIDNRT